MHADKRCRIESRIPWAPDTWAPKSKKEVKHHSILLVNHDHPGFSLPRFLVRTMSQSIQPPTAREARLETLLSERDIQLSELHASPSIVFLYPSHILFRMRWRDFRPTFLHNPIHPTPLLCLSHQQFPLFFFLSCLQDQPRLARALLSLH